MTLRAQVTLTITTIVEIEEDDEHFLEPREDEGDGEEEEYEEFNPKFALAVLDEDLSDDPLEILHQHGVDTADWKVEVLP
jgi:hypothetical protein